MNFIISAHIILPFGRYYVTIYSSYNSYYHAGEDLCESHDQGTCTILQCFYRNRRPCAQRTYGGKSRYKKKVQQAVQELGYTPNHIARSLSGKKTMSIGVVLFNLGNIFFSQLADAIVSTCLDKGYSPYLMLSQKSKKREQEIVDELICRKIDGLILFSTNTDEEFINKLKNCSVPVITVMTLLKDFPFIGIDDRSAMRDATRYVINHHYQRLVYISPPLSYTEMNIEVQLERFRGFQSVVESAPVETIVIKDYDYLATVDKLQFTHAKKTAFLCSSDIYSLNLVRHMKHKGLNAPYDYGVLGFDNIDTLQYVEPLISTISVPIRDIGRRAVEILAAGIAGQPMVSEHLPHAIITGQTII